ncbi:hypothetical protein LEP1GSC201_2783 [Leptospira interrogans serovar Pomona str. Fox 32256]|nr:hypothetical protein [Leptospira interrogans]EMF33719.1 hypothetical protein LEP1GSC201_2783 [Leptospira interrogans serovar Pomona str. Fox 32256]EMI62276.1 hypothetical protein LEP1GSC200_2918 [Leptospira interrogans serovar Pomona str. CSL10083]EMJ58363.1 hypothetical protein LEP1GSC197_1916 [Leptospira interrogans serovar Pomona str. CSL4002]EMN99206.1 hypothetical protein LEP1GSC112_1848 [Leptospira interrogans serovar Pomona str. UT364]
MRVFQAIRGEQKRIHRVSKKDAVDLRVRSQNWLYRESAIISM